jgi:hypothetical protein
LADPGADAVVECRDRRWAALEVKLGPNTVDDAAAGHALRGEPLYGIGSFEFAAYQDPPPFAQVLAPASLLPMPVFVWLWRAVELVGLRLATGGWIRAGIAILVFPPVLAELDAGNVHLAIAGVTALAMRGTAAPVAMAALVKVAGTLRTGSYNVLVFVPVLPRLIVAAALGLGATRWIRLAPIAVLLAYPVVWFHALGTLTAIAALLDRPQRMGANFREGGGWPA